MAVPGSDAASIKTGAMRPSPAGAESTRRRRKFDRQPMLTLVTVTEVDQKGGIGAAWRCQTADISRGGLGMKSRRMVHIGRGLLVEIEGNASADARILFGIVRQARYIPGEGYFVGIQFQAPPGYSPVRRWLAARRQRRGLTGPGQAE